MIEIVKNKPMILYTLIGFFTFFLQCKEKPSVENKFTTSFKFDGQFKTEDETIFTFNKTTLKLFSEQPNHIEILINNEESDKINITKDEHCKMDAVGTSAYQFTNSKDSNLKIIVLEDYQDVLTGSIFAILIENNKLSKTFTICGPQYNYEKYKIKDILSIKKIDEQISFIFDKNKIENNNEQYILNFNINSSKSNSSTNSEKVTSSITKINSKNNDSYAILPSDLRGSWAVICQNELTELDINTSEGYLSLYSYNAIYINLKVEKSTNENEYVLKFANTPFQRVYYEDGLQIVDEDISKEKSIGKLIVKKDGKAELHWIGLYDTKKQKLQFVGDDFLLIKESGGKSPILLEKCE